MAKKSVPRRRRPSPAKKTVGIDGQGKLEEATLRRFVFQTFGRARRTQDSPVMPDVWLRYIRIAEKIANTRGKPPSDVVDLLLTPWSGVRPGDIAKQLRDCLCSRKKTSKRTSDTEYNDHSPYDPRLASARIGLSDSRVVASVNFDTLVRKVVPLTGWWQRLFRKSSKEEFDHKKVATRLEEIFKQIKEHVKTTKKPEGPEAQRVALRSVALQSRGPACFRNRGPGSRESRRARERAADGVPTNPSRVSRPMVGTSPERVCVPVPLPTLRRRPPPATPVSKAAGAEKQSLGSGYRQISITDPGNADKVITVGSTHRRDPHLYGVSYFSARGPTGDGRRKPDVLAPGEKITSLIRGRRSRRMDGTSMAAPHVAGAAAHLDGALSRTDRPPAAHQGNIDDHSHRSQTRAEFPRRGSASTRCVRSNRYERK